MTEKEKIIVCWSGGKDSTMMLNEVVQSNKYDIQALVTTVTEGYDRISMHGVRIALLRQQAQALGFPLEMVTITQGANNQEYEDKMAACFKKFKDQGIQAVAFGDIFLEDLKIYREKHLAQLGMRGIFPIWKRPTKELVNQFIELGFRARLSCIDTKVLDASFAGREIDAALLSDLPSNVDPCGENGEFHSFVYNGPLFQNEVKCVPGETVLRGQFCFADLIPN